MTWTKIKFENWYYHGNDREDYNCLAFDTFYYMDQITSLLNAPALYTARLSKGLNKRLEMVKVQGCQAVLYFFQKHSLHS